MDRAYKTRKREGGPLGDSTPKEHTEEKGQERQKKIQGAVLLTENKRGKNLSQIMNVLKEINFTGLMGTDAKCHWFEQSMKNFRH